MLWTTSETDERIASMLSAELGVSATMGRLLAQRGLKTAESARAYVRPRLADLSDPFDLKNLRMAVTRVEKAIKENQSIVIFGDYDVDGVTSVVQMISLLRVFGSNPRFCVPLRLEEGYGLSRDAIDRVFADGIPDLFIALDCGTNAHESIAYLRGLGCDVIIIDHHQAKTVAPKDCIFINPHVNDAEEAPWVSLCTAGLVFKFLHGLLKSLKLAEDSRAAKIKLKDYLDLVAMGTLADLVHLSGENRILSWFGLRHLRANNRVGVRELAEVCGIDASNEITSSDISFKLAPRINASGRLADATRPVSLLLSEDKANCQQIARELDEINRERQSIQKKMVVEAERRAEQEFANAPGIVLFDKNWHPGVVGIVASRVSRQFYKPCVILGSEGDEAKGSGRSVASVNLVKVFEICTNFLGHWGGHPMAAGVSLKIKNLSAFTECYLQALRALHPEGLAKPTLELSMWLGVEDLNKDLLEELDHLHPFGQGNGEPVFGLRRSVLKESPRVFGENNFRFNILAPNGNEVSGIAWRMHEIPKAGEPLDLAVRFSWNYWRNRRYPQVTLIDWKFSQKEPA